ncbi:FxsA family protein [Halomonas denitrificans]|uniref:FxsA family protein n=1 Tax=Halomonas denitrificans TaxID=370769 RepID=UPI000D33317F|nr:FxsA family protein [Halomonas denitrificans]
MPFLLVFTLFALLDFVILFSVGSQIGLLTTLGLVLATGFIGLHLIRREGVATFARAQERMHQGEIPSGELLTGAALIFGGALLMAPGFLSDALGFMCLIPNARRLLARSLTWLGVRMQGLHVRAETYRPRQGRDADWQQASPHGDGPTEHHGDSGEAGGDRPLEGEFISRDERR